jgi:hypothetical protein
VCLTKLSSSTVGCTSVDLSPASGPGARRVVFPRDGLDPTETYKVQVTRTSGRVELDGVVVLR